MIVYLSPHRRGEIHSGGVEKLYDHVDILREAGFDARVAVNDLSLDPDDLLVVPEIYGDVLTQLPGIAKVSLNQNAHLTWSNVQGRHPYVDNPDLLAVLCVSQHNRWLLQYAFPGLRVEGLPLSIRRPDLFRCGDFPRGRRMAYFARKRAKHADLVLNMLTLRSASAGWDVAALDGMSDEKVAQTLRESAIFLSFSELEGSAAPPREALACGCRVIGYGQGADIEMRWHMEVVAEDDVLGFAQAVEREMEASDSERAVRRGREASEWVQRAYSREAEVERLTTLFTELTAKSRATATA